ncbi:GntR family transcriptional regulator [Rhodococcus koreensis]
MSTGTAKYASVRDHLQGRIAKMTVGTKLPSEPVLCEEYGVSRITVRRAVDELIREGLLVREQGRGTFVTEPKYVQQVRETFSDRVTGFYRQQTALGRTVSTKVIQNHLVRDPDAAAALNLNPADELVELERLRYVNDTLHQHVTTYVSAARFPGVLDRDFTDGSLYEYLAEEYGVTLIRNNLLVSLDQADAHIAAALHVSGGQAILTIESTVFDQDDQPVAYGIARHTPANSSIAFSLTSQPVELPQPATR